LTVLPYSVVFLSRRSMPLDVLPLRIEHPDRQLGLMTMTGQTQAPALRRFSGFLTAEFHRLRNLMDHELQMARRGG
jgi:hypothetical protein